MHETNPSPPAVERVSATNRPGHVSGGGEMGELFRSLDWSTTALGPVESWPQSLRTAVSMMLDSGFAMVVAWGPQFILLYNDRYRPVLGATKHPTALGRPAREVFPEVWDFIGPLFDKTRAGQTVALDDVLIPLDRNGYLEECYFTLSYSPIRDESGGVGGMLAVVAETTERVQGERRMATLRHLARRAMDAKTPEQACRDAAAVLADNPIDLPFSLLYLSEDNGKRARLVGHAGLGSDTPAAPVTITLHGEDAETWPLSRASDAPDGVVVTDLAARFGPLPGGAAAETTHTAMVLPLTRRGHDHPYGWLIGGVSPRRALDDRYRTFFELCTEHVATALVNAHAHADERRRAEALAEIDRAKTVFFSNVSHEFRTPLTLMLGPTEDALASTDGALRGEDLRAVHRNELRLLKMVNALLEFSRLEAGRAQAVYQPVDLAAVTAELASSFRSAIERAGLGFDVRCPPLPEPVYVDVEMWEKIVLNLLSNAFKFTFEGKIEVALRWLGDRVELSVHDTGVGIPENELPRVFERFHRGDDRRARTHEGSGIGLALVHELTRLHGGTVTVDSEPGRGSTFRALLPTGRDHLAADRIGVARTQLSTAVGVAPFVAEALRWQVTPDAETTDAQTPHATEEMARPECSRSSSIPPRPSAPPPRDGAARILIADDNADMRDYLTRLLADRWTVDAAADGATALQLARKRRYELVLTDVMMPGLDGFALTTALRDNANTRHVPIIMLSARAGEESVVQGLDGGADDYLIKPFGKRELLARVEGHLHLGRLRRELERERARLYAVLTEVPALIVVTRGRLHLVELSNPQHRDANGGRDVVGQRLPDTRPARDADEITSMLDAVFEDGQARVARAVRTAFERSAGQLDERYLDWTAIPIRDYSGEIEGMLSFAYDVTELAVARRNDERAQAELREQARISETLYRIGRTLNAELELDKVVGLLTDEATALCRAEFGALFYNVKNADGESYMLYTLSGIPRERFENYPMPRNTAVFAPTFNGEGPVRSDDIKKDPRYGQSAPHFGMPPGHAPVTSYLAVPVISRSGAVIGGLFFGHSRPAVFKESDEHLLVAVAAQAAAALDNARLYQQAREARAAAERARERTEKLRSITAALSQTSSAEEGARIVLRETMPMLGASVGCVMLLGDDQRELELLAADDEHAAVLAERVPRVPLQSRRPITDAVAQRTLVWAATPDEVAERYPEAVPLQALLNVRSMGAVALSAEGRVFGAVAFACPEARALGPDDIDFLNVVGRECAQLVYRSRLLQEARAARAEAERGSRAKDEFLAMLGHELRNPLAPIVTALQLMTLRGDSRSHREREVIGRQVHHLTRLVDDLLDVSRITRGKIELKRTRVDLGDVLAKAVEIAAPWMDQFRHHLDVSVEQTKLSVDADEVRLAQVFGNLLSNAAKYTDAGGRIHVDARKEGTDLVVRVTDTGIGIAPELVPQVFDLFVQGYRASDRAPGGLGLGLTLVRSLVEMHGGTVAAHSQGIGKGSEFIVRLPAAPGGADEERPPSPGTAAPVAPSTLRVLVVDDNTDAAELMVDLLASVGHDVRIAYDGPAALAITDSFSPDVAILDIGLPGMDGYELAARLRAKLATPPRLVAVTGYGQKRDIQRSQAAGFQVHLVKPVQPQQLLATLRGDGA